MLDFDFTFAKITEPKRVVFIEYYLMVKFALQFTLKSKKGEPLALANEEQTFICFLLQYCKFSGSLLILMQALRVEHCERVQVISVTRRICIANCRECVFYLGVNEQPLILGDNHKLKVSFCFINYAPHLLSMQSLLL